MLTVPITRITILLEHASDIDVSPEEEIAIAESAAVTEPEGADDELATELGDDPAYQMLMAALGGLSRNEVYELLAVAFMGEEGRADSWEEAVEQARSVAEEDALPELARILIFTDAVESGLDRLGYSSDEAETSDDEVRDEEAEEVAD